MLAQRQSRARGIQHAHGLVRQLSVGQVAVGQAHCRLRAVVQDPNFVVFLEGRHDAAHHHLARLLRRLLHLDELESPRQGRVFLEVFLVLGPRRGGDGAQLATRQRGLQQVSGVALAGRAAGADHRMGLIDEEDDRRG